MVMVKHSKYDEIRYYFCLANAHCFLFNKIDRSLKMEMFTNYNLSNVIDIPNQNKTFFINGPHTHLK